jgi:hypothetical protein
MDEAELTQLGLRMRALFEQLMTEEPGLDIPRQAQEAAVRLP